jgi:CelD/BcsL family acetyltransferase involved in cellulose biosynthesis
MDVNMGRWSRKKIRTIRRKLESEESLQISVANETTHHKDIDILCELWYNRWKDEFLAEWHSHFLHYYFRENLLRLTIMSSNGKPIAALAVLKDPLKKTFNNYITSYDPEYASLSPGIALLSESVEYAIESRYKYYDFTIGLDPYKLSFGPDQFDTHHLFIRKRSFKMDIILPLIRKLRKK